MSKRAMNKKNVFPKGRKSSKASLKSVRTADDNAMTQVRNIDPVPAGQSPEACVTPSPDKGDNISPGTVTASTMLVRKESIRGLVSTLSLYNMHEYEWGKWWIPVLLLLIVVLFAVSAMTVWVVMRRRVTSPDVNTSPTTGVCVAPSGDPQVTLESLGTTVHGKIDQSRQLRKFFGIPYGRNVSAIRRFQRAQAVTSLGENGSFYAYRHGSDCPQGGLAKQGLDEECLTLSIWIPVVCATSSPLKSVLVVVASEWFQFDSAVQLNSTWETLSLGGDIAVVTIRHRLGLLGFLDTSSMDASGYAGVEDVFLALKWISEHIAAFHGDPNGLVGFGFGSGAYILSMDLFAETLGRKKFFKRLLLHGLSPTSLVPRADPNDVSRLVTAMQCPSKISQSSLTDCLRNVTLKRIYEETAKLPPLFFAPDCDRPPFDGCDEVFSKLPASLRGIEILCGYNIKDGREFFNEHFQLPENLKTQDLFDQLQMLFTGEERHTFQDLPVEIRRELDKGGKANLGGFMELVSDMSFRCPMIELARQTADRGASVYLYDSDATHKLLEPALMMADIIAFVKRG
ncbi:hypothetical protein HPB50_020053 [Hyalomma asiaticum]|uniref:Uncharacterized protein n=1 Tax=Hyalomma asiaticum TaxID=266040 RepID=A0ACB7SDQ0_HYAAI|nr:hypothetical protein HPB50_020053 [Hyalomma asiaticum]